MQIGEGGIDKGYLTPEAIERAKNALGKFRTTIEKLDVKDVMAIGTSALRNAENSTVLIDLMNDWGWKVQVIDGKREAELIYKGILLDERITSDTTSLIMDIGGGSVEFIIGNNSAILWSESFEIGAQRLVHKFHKSDLITTLEIKSITEYLEHELKPLSNAIREFLPMQFIGSSGTFDTILEIRNTSENKSENFIDTEEFKRIRDLIINSPLEERKKIPGMMKERAGMIVTASLLLDYVLKLSGIPKFFVSSNALKEGLIFEALQE